MIAANDNSAPANAGARAYYNEIDPYAAAWLRNLITAGMIAPGDVDERSVVDVRPTDLRGYAQCHFFAGIGVWSYALRKAGWSDAESIWTGSCPCQPFSAAGKGCGFDDERHLWPHFHYLIEQCRPAIVLGEQVASKDGLAWLDLVQSDLEGTGYACGAVDTCSASVGAPHIRQRLRFAAVRMGNTGRNDMGRHDRAASRTQDESEGGGQVAWDRCVMPGPASSVSQLADADRFDGDGTGYGSSDDCGQQCRSPAIRGVEVVSTDRPSPTNGFWRDPDWLYCRDGKWRPVEPGTFPLAHGAPARVGRLRAYGNAVDAEATREFCEALMMVAANDNQSGLSNAA